MRRGELSDDKRGEKGGEGRETKGDGEVASGAKDKAERCQ